MASSECVKEPLAEFKIFMRCTICLDTLDQPRTLPCLHTFCTACLEQHVDLTTAMSVSGRLSFRCPACREETALPIGGVAGFRKDFRMEQVRELLKNKENEGRNEIPHSVSRCGICSGSMDEDLDLRSGSTFFCEDCCKKFCEMCSQVHGQIPVFSGHTVVECNPVQSCLNDEAKCAYHQQDTINYICQDCVKPICATCVMKFHGDHVVVPKNVGLKEMVDELNFHHKALMTRKAHIRDFLTQVKHNTREIRVLRNRLVEKIKYKTKELIEDVYRQEKKLIQEIEEKFLEEQSRLSHTQHHLDGSLSEMSASTVSTADVLAQKPDLDNLQQYAELTSNLARIVEDSLVFDFTPSFLKMSFVSSVTKPKLGRLSVATSYPQRRPLTGLQDFSEGSDPEDSGTSSPENSPRLRTSVATSTKESEPKVPIVASLLARLGTFGPGGGEFNMPRDVHFMPGSSQFAVCDTNNERLQVFDTRGLLVAVIGQGVIRPWGVTCTPHGEYVITDNVDKCVKVYSQDGILLKQLGTFLCPCGIELTSRGHIVVTDFFSTCVYIMTMTGEIVKQIKYRDGRDRHACGPSRVAVTTNDVIVIADVSNAAVKAYDQEGDELWCVSGSGSLLSPQGLCVTEAGLILVTDSVNHSVVQLDVTGALLGAVQIQDSTLKEPTAIDVSSQGMCVIGRMKANEVRVYKLCRISQDGH